MLSSGASIDKTVLDWYSVCTINDINRHASTEIGFNFVADHVLQLYVADWPYKPIESYCHAQCFPYATITLGVYPTCSYYTQLSFCIMIKSEVCYFLLYAVHPACNNPNRPNSHSLCTEYQCYITHQNQHDPLQNALSIWLPQDTPPPHCCHDNTLIDTQYYIRMQEGMACIYNIGVCAETA